MWTYQNIEADMQFAVSRGLGANLSAAIFKRTKSMFELMNASRYFFKLHTSLKYKQNFLTSDA